MRAGVLLYHDAKGRSESAQRHEQLTYITVPEQVIWHSAGAVAFLVSSACACRCWRFARTVGLVSLP
jgi:hypothetical protein